MIRIWWSYVCVQCIVTSFSIFCSVRTVYCCCWLFVRLDILFLQTFNIFVFIAARQFELSLSLTILAIVVSISLTFSCLSSSDWTPRLDLPCIDPELSERTDKDPQIPVKPSCSLLALSAISSSISSFPMWTISAIRLANEHSALYHIIEDYFIDPSFNRNHIIESIT